MRYKEPPKKNVFSYLLPFVIIIVIGLGGFFTLRDYLYKNISLKPPVTQPDARVSFVHGSQAFLTRRGLNDRSTLRATDFVTVGDVVSTEKESLVELQLFEGSVIRLNQDTVISFTRLENFGNEQHISLQLVRGELYIDNPGFASDASDFLVTTPQTISQINGTTVLMDTFPVENVLVLSGGLRTNVFHNIDDRKEPLVTVTVSEGEEVYLDADTLKKLISGGSYFARPARQRLASATTNGDEDTQHPWYTLENLPVLAVSDLGSIAIDTDAPDLEASIVHLAQGLPGYVTVLSPHPKESVGSAVSVEGYYDSEHVKKIFVNGKQAQLDGEKWMVNLLLRAHDKMLEITYEDTDGSRYLVENRPVLVDDSGPNTPTILQPSLDASHQAEIFGDSVVITGSASDDIERIVVIADKQTPYQLQKYTSGDDLFYYKASRQIGNLQSGRNVYTFQFYDTYDNVSTLTATLFASFVKEDNVLSTLPLKITQPSVSPFVTQEIITAIQGIVDGDVRKIYINGDPIEYHYGDTEFSTLVPLHVGDNDFMIQIENGLNDITDVTTLRVVKE